MENSINANQIHHILLWVYNFTKADFAEAFKGSELGGTYFYDRYLEGNPAEKGSSSAMISMILNMEYAYQEMLFEYIINKKYEQDLVNREENIAFINSATWEDTAKES